jgi:hypothetical protein
MPYTTFHLQYTTMMRQAGVSHDSTQAHYFKNALNEHDRYLLTSDTEFGRTARHHLHSRFWPTFHVSILKSILAGKPPFQPGMMNMNDQILQPIRQPGQPLFEVDRILGHRKYGKDKFEFLIGFRVYPDS